MVDRTTIRRAEPADERRLRAIAAAAKGYWGYDADRVAAWAAALELSSAGEAKEELYVAELGGRVVGWLALLQTGDVCVLDHLWVEPPSFGMGIGSDLFAFAAARARQIGASRLELEAEPNAIGFYQKVGAVRVGETVGNWGRPLPVMALELGR
jgi:ribosomal protein S18 acetylase RimI-like enzyme